MQRAEGVPTAASAARPRPVPPHTPGPASVPLALLNPSLDASFVGERVTERAEIPPPSHPAPADAGASCAAVGHVTLPCGAPDCPYPAPADALQYDPGEVRFRANPADAGGDAGTAKRQDLNTRHIPPTDAGGEVDALSQHPVAVLSRYAGHLADCASHADAEEIACSCGYVGAWNAVFSRPAQARVDAQLLRRALDKVLMRVLNARECLAEGRTPVAVDLRLQEAQAIASATLNRLEGTGDE